MIILSQFEIILIVAAIIAVFYVGYILGNFERRMPKQESITDGWWQEDGQRNDN